MASRTPATFLQLQSRLGSIAPGYRADLVAFSSKFEVLQTWVAGRPLGI
jgi:N-acetylglucosamine-6-phosphate deacetylase